MEASTVCYLENTIYLVTNPCRCTLVNCHCDGMERKRSIDTSCVDQLLRSLDQFEDGAASSTSVKVRKTSLGMKEDFYSLRDQILDLCVYIIDIKADVMYSVPPCI